MDKTAQYSAVDQAKRSKLCAVTVSTPYCSSTTPLARYGPIVK